jgi:hypothetical protein
MIKLRAPADFFIFDPSRRDVIYAWARALWRSADGGATWRLVYPAPADVRRVAISGDHAEEKIVTAAGSPERITALAVDPSRPEVLYAAFEAGGK